jgi:hypothetical protein
MLSDFVRNVQTCFEGFAEALFRGSRCAAEIHAENVSRHQPLWNEISDEATCLTCLHHAPVYPLPCRHDICKVCVQVFGEASEGDDSEFIIKHCLLCQSKMPEGLLIRIHPPTAGVGVLCIDGGGVKGAMPLGILKRLQDKIDLPIPIQRFVKVAFGISSGKSHHTSTQAYFCNRPPRRADRRRPVPQRTLRRGVDEEVRDAGGYCLPPARNARVVAIASLLEIPDTAAGRVAAATASRGSCV